MRTGSSMRRLSSSSMKLRSSSARASSSSTGRRRRPRVPRPPTRRSARCPVLPGESGSDRSSRGWRRRPGRWSLTWCRSGSLFPCPIRARPSGRRRSSPSNPPRLTTRRVATAEAPGKAGTGVNPPPGLYGCCSCRSSSRAASWSPAACSWFWSSCLAGRARRSSKLVEELAQPGRAVGVAPADFLQFQGVRRQARVVQAAAQLSRGWAARPPRAGRTALSSCRRPGWSISSGRTASAATATRAGSASSTSSSWRSSGGGRGRAFGLAPRPASRGGRGSVAPPRCCSQFVQSRPYGLLLESQSLSDAVDHQLRLDRAGLSGQRRRQGDDAQHRSTARRRPSTPRRPSPASTRFSLKSSASTAPSSTARKASAPCCEQQVARVQPARQRGDGQVHVLADEDLQRPVHARVAAGVGVEDQHHARGEAAELLDVAGVQGRAHRGHHLADAHLVGHQHVGVALHHGQVAGGRRRRAEPWSIPYRLSLLLKRGVSHEL